MQSGTSLPELMELGGWKSYEMVLRYAHLAPDEVELRRQTHRAATRSGSHGHAADRKRSSRRYVFTTVGALMICKPGLRHPPCNGRHNLEVNACNWETACLGLPQRIRLHNHIRDLPSPAFAHCRLNLRGVAHDKPGPFHPTALVRSDRVQLIRQCETTCNSVNTERCYREKRKIGGERGIRTLDGLLAHTPLAGARLRPLGHLSGFALPLGRGANHTGRAGTR